MILIFSLLIILSLGAVSAQELNDTAAADSQDTDQITEDQTPDSTSDKSFSDLNDLIMEPGDTIDINYNYTFDSQKDAEYSNGFLFANGSFVINGNFNTIDARGNASVFKLSNANLTINNLFIKNSKSSAIYCQYARLTTNNVTFINNQDNTGGAVFLSGCDYESTGDKFINNLANYGSAIYSYDSSLSCQNDLFISEGLINWGLIYGEHDSLIYVENSTFLNTTSRYATAIYNEGKVRVLNSKFYNLHANYTAGAIGVKVPTMLTVDGCEFVNVSSKKNGGAIFADIFGSDPSNAGTVTILYSNFTNCSSDFGGAILHLGGNLTIENSNFISNSARYNGGAVYTSNSTFNSFKNNFIGNLADVCGANSFSGGAMYLDNGDIFMSYCEFINNNASSGDGLYLYDVYYEITNSRFINNGEAIYEVFGWKESFEKNNEFNTDTVSLENTFYATNVFYSGKQIVLNPIVITASVDDVRFDLRDWNAVTPVKNQGSMGACWAFGSTAALESAFLIATNITIDISENNIQDTFLRYSIYGPKIFTEEGLITSGLGYFLSWLGPVNVEYDSYDELGKISPVIFSDDSYHIQDAVLVNTSHPSEIKDALIKYGALSVFICSGSGGSLPYYNSNTSSLYVYNESMAKDHIVAIVGWDDNYSASNFYVNPPGDGAWICRNSWGDQWGDNGYFYISYYDVKFWDDVAVGYLINNVNTYNKLYQYDIGLLSNFAYVSNPSYRNFYVSAEDDLIAAVGTYFENANQDYTITVYVGDESVYVQSGKSKYSGFETIILDEYVPVGQNQDFSVDIKTKSIPVIGGTRLYFKEGSSVAYYEGESEDLSKAGIAASVKVYTVSRFESQVNVSAVNITFGANVSIVADVAANATGDVIFTVDNHNYTVGIVDGKAILNRVLPNLNVGSYDVVAFYEGDGYYAPVESQPFTFNVEKASTDLDIVSKNKMLYVLFSENATGNATVIIDGRDIVIANISGSRIVVDMHAYSDGQHNVSVIYGGDSNYFNNSGNSSVTLKEINSKISIVMIDGLEITSVLMDSEGKAVSNVLVAYTISQSDEMNVTTNGDGEFTIKAANNCVLDIFFRGNENVTGCNASIIIKNLRPVQKATMIEVPSTMTKTAVDYKAGEKGTMFYFYLKDADGKALANKGIKIGIFDKIYTVKTDGNGRGGLQINIANANYYTYALSFLGDDDYKASFAVCSLQIVKKPITITPAKTSYSFKASAKTKTVTATLKSTNSYIPKGKQVTLTIAGKTFKATIGAKGQISFNIGSITKKGTYNVAIKYVGSNTYSAATSKNIKIVIK